MRIRTLWQSGLLSLLPLFPATAFAQPVPEPPLPGQEPPEAPAPEEDAPPGAPTESVPEENERSEVRDAATSGEDERFEDESGRSSTDEPAPGEPQRGQRDPGAPHAAEPAPTSVPEEPSGAPTEQPPAVTTDPEEELDVVADDDIHEIDEVIVSGARLGRTPGSAHVIGKRQLERFEYDDSQAILLQVPGVYVRQEDGIGLRPNIGIRGVSPDRSKKLTLMEDGILFGPAPYSAPAAYFFPLMTRMNQVRVIKGPGAIAYGPQTVGGAIDFISRPIPTRTAGGLDVGIGEYGYNKAHAHFGSTDGQTGFLIEGVRLQNTGFMELPSGADTGSTRNEWVAKASYLIDPEARTVNEVSIKFMYSDEVSNETYLGQTDADFRSNPYRRYAASALDQMKSHRTGIVLGHVLEVPDSSVKLTTSAYRNEMSRSWNKLNRFGAGPVPALMDNPEYYGVLTGELDSAGAATTLYIGPNARDFISQGVQTRLDWDVETGSVQHRIEAGLRLHHDAVSRRHSESGYLMANGRLLRTEDAPRITQKNEAQTHAIAIHVTDAVTWSQLTVTPGVRMELLRAEMTDLYRGGQSEHYVGAVLPGLGAFYGITDDFGILAGVHRGFSPPAPPDPDPNAPVDSGPEYSVNYEAGARYLSGPSRLELIGFFSDYSNLTSICTFAGSCLEENVDRQFDAGAAHIYGLEAFASHELPAGPLTLPITVAYTHTRSELKNAFFSGDPTLGSVEPGYELPYLPRHQVVFSVGAETKRVGGVISAHYISPMRETAGDEPLDQVMATDSQVWLDAGASFRLLEYLSLYANLRNLLGAENIVSRRPYGARPNPPRWVQVGAKLDF